MMVLCDREGKVYDVWITFGSMHEVWAFREWKKRSVWFWELVEVCVVYGDWGYRGCDGGIVCDSREMRASSTANSSTLLASGAKSISPEWLPRVICPIMLCAPFLE